MHLRSRLAGLIATRTAWCWFGVATVVLWLFFTLLVVALPLGYEQAAYRCSRAERLRVRFEELLFPRTGAVGMVGPDGTSVANYEGPVPVAREIAACFPGQVVDNRLRLPAGEYPAVFQSAVLAAFDLSQGERDADTEWHARFYPMNSPAAPCVLAAVRRLHEAAEGTIPPQDPRCRGLLWPHLLHWLLLGWLPVVVLVLVGSRLRAGWPKVVATPHAAPPQVAQTVLTTGPEPHPAMAGKLSTRWQRVRAIGLALLAAYGVADGLIGVVLVGPSRGLPMMVRALLPALAYWVVAYLLLPWLLRILRRLPD